MTARETRTGPVIVVGVNGSPASDDALRWAVAEATDRHGRVIAVGVRPSFPAARHAPQARSLSQAERDSVAWAGWLHERIERARAGIENPAHVVEIMTVGDPAVELRRLAGDADLVVLAGRGSATLFGAASTRQHLCPIVIMPDQRSAPAGTAPEPGGRP